MNSFRNAVTSTENTNFSMKQGPCLQGNRFASSQQIPPILWNPKVHYHTNVTAICPYPEPGRSNPNYHIPLPQDLS